MDAVRTLPVITYDAAPLQAASPFSYECHRCNRCCTHKGIRVNPYEVFRLSRARGMSTTRFIAEHMVDGMELRQREDGRCSLLGPGGCTVHGDRPLVCRLYPLSRLVRQGEPDRFAPLEAHPLSEGVLGTQGEVQHYLAAQGVAPFIRAADEYLALTLRLMDTLHALEGDARTGAGDSIALLDIDATLGATGTPVPDDPEAAMACHIAALDAWRAAFTTHDGVQP